MVRVSGTQASRFLRAKRGMIVRGTRHLRLWLEPIWFAILLAVIAVGCLSLLGRWYGQFSDMSQGVFVEAVGATMDIVVFGIIIALFVFIRDRRLEISRQMELIDDFKKWNSDEARYRIAGAVRRLNRLGRTAIDFSGIEISNFSFRRHDIESIAGSTFYDGSWGTMGSKDNVKLKEVDFGELDCRNVIFSKFNPLSGLRNPIVFASFRDCNFVNAQLCGAIFRGAHIEWSGDPPKEMGDWEDVRSGEKAFLQTYYPPFDGADLGGVSFEKAYFKKADFRHAVNIQDCDFRGTHGLDGCVFDNDEVRKSVLESARHASQ